VTGTSSHVWIVYRNATHGIDNVQDVGLPWHYEWSTATTGDLLAVSAFIGADVRGELTATIRKNGAIVATKTAAGGQFTTVDVSATF